MPSEDTVNGDDVVRDDTKIARPVKSHRVT
jgi:hypothetical protein